MKIGAYDNNNVYFVNCYGEVKPLSKAHDTEKILIDLYRICVFSRSAIDKCNLQAVLSCQCVGK